MFKSRSEEVEIMDDLSLGGHEMDQTLRELEIINKWLGGDYVTLNGLKKIFKNYAIPSHQEITIVDLGCGGGDTLIKIADWAKAKNYKVKLIGIDANQHIVDYAIKKCASYENISFQCVDIFSEAFRNQKFDIVASSLFTHHFTDEQLVKLYAQLKLQAKYSILVNDLHRHFLAYYSIDLISKALSKSEMVKHDGKLSVLRAFRKNELESIFNHAQISNYTILWMWAFRWQVIVNLK